MGLDISYYGKVERIGDPDPDGYDDNKTQLYVNAAFLCQADGLTGGTYAVEGGDGFCAGSYSGYSRWREQLARLAGYEAADAFAGNVQRHESFVDLVNFSDCEGVIGPVTSGRLAHDFASHQGDADNHSDPFFRDLYAKWRRAFETAAKGGAVDFH